MSGNYTSFGSKSLSYNPWASKSWESAYSWQKERARFQQKQLREKEEKLLKLYDEQQKRALKSVGSKREGILIPSNSSVGGGGGGGGGKVRYLFQSRRFASERKPTVGITGRDKSYPLEPLESNNSGTRNCYTDHRISNKNLFWYPHQRSFSLDRNKSKYSSFNEFNLDTNENLNIIHVKKNKPIVNKKENGCQNFSTRPESQKNYKILQEPTYRRNFDIYNNNNNNNSNSNFNLKNAEFDDNILIDKNVTKFFGQDKSTERKLKFNNIAGCDTDFNKMDRKFRNYVSQSTTVKKSEGVRMDGKLTTSLSSDYQNSSVNSPIRKIRKPTPVPQSVAPTHFLDKGIKKTTRNDSIPETSQQKTVKTTRTVNSPASKTSTSYSNRLPSSELSSKSNISSDLVDCKICGRHFDKDRVSKHEEVCLKSKRTKRKPFDALQQRVKGTEVEKYVKKSKTVRNLPEKSPKPQNNWRKKHEEFIQNIRAAKEVSAHLKKGGKLSDLPPPPPSDYSDYIQCPHCLRKFCSAAAERHIPKCVNIINNKPKSGLQKNTTLKQNSKIMHSATSSVRSRK